MRQTARIWVQIWIAMAAAGAVALIYARVTGMEPLLAGGVTVLVLSGLMIPVMVKRAALQRKIDDGAGLLARWEYSPDEAEKIAAGSRWGKRAILRQPCRTRIGRDCLLVANRYHPLNDYSRLSAEHAQFVPACESMAVLRVKYSFWAGKRYSRYEKLIDIPVPLGREHEAQALAEKLGGNKQKDAHD